MPKTRRPRQGRTLSANSAAALRQLLAYVHDDEQSHCFSCAPDERANHIYMQAVRPLALASGFRSKAELIAEEREYGDDSDGHAAPMTTAARADRARQVLAHYVTARGDTFEGSSSEITDLIADLLHLAARIDADEQPISSTLERARRHYEAERAEDAS